MLDLKNLLCLATITILSLFLAAVLLSVIFNKYLPVWFCRRIGWHLRPNEIGFDGCSLNGICPRCGKEVLQDSQGNWF